MSGATPNDKHPNHRSHRQRRPAKQSQAQATTNAEPSRLETPLSYDDDFPSLYMTTTNQNAIPTSFSNTVCIIYHISFTLFC